MENLHAIISNNKCVPISDENHSVNIFKFAFNDDSKIIPKNNSHCLLVACNGVLPEFTLGNHPYISLKKGQLITQ